MNGMTKVVECDECGANVHPLYLHACQGCGELLCESCEGDSSNDVTEESDMDEDARIAELVSERRAFTVRASELELPIWTERVRIESEKQDLFPPVYVRLGAYLLVIPFISGTVWCAAVPGDAYSFDSTFPQIDWEALAK